MTVQLARGEVSRSGASDFAHGGKVTKTPLGAAAPRPRFRSDVSLHGLGRRGDDDTGQLRIRWRSLHSFPAFSRLIQSRLGWSTSAQRRSLRGCEEL